MSQIVLHCKLPATCLQPDFLLLWIPIYEHWRWLPRPSVASHALITSNIFASVFSGDISSMPNARPLKSASPRGTVATGNPAAAATLAMRLSAGPRMTSISFSAKDFFIALVARWRVIASLSLHCWSVMLLLRAPIKTS